MRVDFIASGGSARGLLIIGGAYEALIQKGMLPERVAGNSAGGVVAGCIAAGIGPSDLYNLMMETDFENFITTSFWSKLRVVFCGALSNGKAFHRFLRQITKDKEFGQNRIDARIVATDIDAAELKVFSKQDTPEVKLADAMRMTAALPAGFDPFEYKGKLYWDGGLYKHFPIDIFQDHPRPTVGILISSGNGAWEKHKNIVDVLDKTIDLLVDANVDAAMEKVMDLKDMCIARSSGMGVSGFKFDFTRKEKKALWNHGRNVMMEELSKVEI